MADKAVPSVPPYESCPSPACGATITSFPDCPECLTSGTEHPLNLQCDSCWTDCASPCNDDDCHIPQPCYDEHCAVESCVDSACAAEGCTDVTCPETVHCNATCFDTNCLYNFGEDAVGYDSENCGQGHCFGFLPTATGFGGMNDLSFECPQAAATHTMGGWEQHLALPDHGYPQPDHADSNRHKRRRVESAEYASFDQQSEPWSDDQLDALFSPQPLNSPFGQTFPGTFDMSCDPTCHHQFKHDDPWANEMANSLPCQPATENSPSKLKRRAPKGPARLLPAPSTEMQPPYQSIFDTHHSSPSADLEHVCQWVDPSGNICSHRFATEKDLDDHLQAAHTSKLGPQNFVCCWSGCNTVFKHRGKLNRHISGAHSKYHAHICTYIDPSLPASEQSPCGRTFCTKEQLKNHMTTHTGERKYKCRFCDHTSATKTQHNTHERIHTKEKPYKCPWCGHRSGDSSNLSKHVRNKHPGMGTGMKHRKSVSLDVEGMLA